MSSTDWSAIDFADVPPRVQRLIQSKPRGKVQAVHHYEIAPAIAGEHRPVFVVSHNDDRSRVFLQRTPYALVLFQNSYLTSFVDDLVTFALTASDRGENLEELCNALARKYVAEQMLTAGPSEMARVLFLESLIGFEPRWRRLYEVRNADTDGIGRRSQVVTRTVSQFLMHHELGHVAEADSRYAEITGALIDTYLAERESNERTRLSALNFEEEAQADLFALYGCMAIAARQHNASVVKSLLDITVRATVVLDVLYAIAHDLHRVNVDPQHQVDIDSPLTLWPHREALLLQALDDFSFGPHTFEACSDDLAEPFVFPEHMWPALTDIDAFLAPVTDDIRRVSQVIAQGFEFHPEGFRAVVEGSRTEWLLTSA